MRKLVGYFRLYIEIFGLENNLDAKSEFARPIVLHFN